MTTLQDWQKLVNDNKAKAAARAALSARFAKFKRKFYGARTVVTAAESEACKAAFIATLTPEQKALL